MKVEYSLKYQNQQKINYVKRCNRLQDKNINFKAYNVHIVDGAAHGSYIEHFAEAMLKKIPTEINIKFHNTKVNPKISSLKQMDGLEQTLRALNNSEEVKKGDYVTIPALANIGLLNLKERISSVLLKQIDLTPLNINSNKTLILNFLKRVYYNKLHYLKEISYMDKDSVELSYVYGVIQQINKLVQKGVNVYIPSGHPQDNTIKWMAKEQGLNEELYRYLSHPKTASKDDVKRIMTEITSKNWYDFNLLTLSKAKVVNVDKQDGKRFIFGAFDSCSLGDSAPGVYNLSPVRDNWHRVNGYSFTDEKTNEYPFIDFPHNEKIRNLTHFVGLDARELIATNAELRAYKYKTKREKKTDNLPDKIYKISEVFNESQIRERKLDYLGGYINNKQDLIFDINKDGNIIYNKLNYEGSGKPSVFSMWGSCFSTINAIKRDILARLNSESVLGKSTEASDSCYIASQQAILESIKGVDVSTLDMTLNCFEDLCEKQNSKKDFLNRQLNIVTKIIDWFKGSNEN